MRISDWSSDVCSSDLSPTGDWIAFRENYNAFLMPFFGGAETIEAGAKASQLPVTRVSGDGGQYLHWGAGGRTLAIGRASCRERGCQYVSISVVAGSLKKKKTRHQP